MEFRLYRTSNTEFQCDSECEFGFFIPETPCYKVAEWVIVRISDKFHWMHVCEKHAYEALQKANSDWIRSN